MSVWMVYDEGTQQYLGLVEAKNKTDALQKAEDKFCVMVTVIKTKINPELDVR